MSETDEPTQLRGIGSFGMIPEWLLIAPISSTAKVVFGWMACKYASRATWSCWPGQARLAADLQVSVNTIASAMKELQDVGALTKRRRMDAAGAPATNYYQLMFLPTHEKLGIPQKTEAAYPQKTVGGYPQKTVDKPEVLEPEVLEREVPAPLIESPIRFHKRHAGHVSSFCDWMCLPQEMVVQFANRGRMTEAQVIAWATEVRAQWHAEQRVPTDSMFSFWGDRWKERHASSRREGAEAAPMNHYYAARAKRDEERARRDEQQREATRKQLAMMAAWAEEQNGER
jgi:hypothetical protein